MTIKTTSPREDGPAKKRYESPRLEVYGDIRVVTEAVGHDATQSDNVHGLKTS